MESMAWNMLSAPDIFIFSHLFLPVAHGIDGVDYIERALFTFVSPIFIFFHCLFFFNLSPMESMAWNMLSASFCDFKSSSVHSDGDGKTHFLLMPMRINAFTLFPNVRTL
jgi:hypothetical protein